MVIVIGMMIRALKRIFIPQDSTAVGFDAGDEASDVTTPSSVSNLKPPVGAGMKRSRSHESRSRKGMLLVSIRWLTRLCYPRVVVVVVAVVVVY